MQQKKIIVVATGGTIAMKYDEASQGLIPACSGEDLAAAVPGIDKLAQLEFCQFCLARHDTRRHVAPAPQVRGISCP